MLYHIAEHALQRANDFPGKSIPRGGGGTLGISGWGRAAGTLEPLAYTRASSAEFYYPILE